MNYYFVRITRLKHNTRTLHIIVLQLNQNLKKCFMENLQKKSTRVQGY